MKMHVWLIALIALVLAAGTALAAVNTQYMGNAPDFRVTISMQDPDPVEPGREVEVSFKIENNGTSAENVAFEIVPEYPFSLVSGESALRQIGTIATSQESKQSVIVRYKLKVAQEAIDGNHELKARYKIGGFDSWILVEDFNVKVRSYDAIIAVENFITEPSVVAPGSKTKLNILLRNYATSLLKNVKIVLALGESSDESTPFSPLGSTNEQVISYISPQSTKLIEFELLADPDAASKSYKIPLIIRYSDAANNNYSKSNIVTVVVGDEPDISVGVESTTILTAGSAGEVTIKIVNKGFPDMKFVNVKLGKSDKYSVISSDEVYVGNIDSDDYETAEFKMYAEKTSEKKLLIPLVVEYKDANNKDYRSAVNLELPLYSASEAKKLGLVKGNGNSYWVILVILAVAGFFAYRMWKRRRKHN